MSPLHPIQQAALDQLVPIALAAEKQTGFPCEAVIAQFAAESDWGLKPTGNFNYWGLTRKVAPARPQKLCTTREVLTQQQIDELDPAEKATITTMVRRPDGKFDVRLSRLFPCFDSMEQAVHQYIALIVTSPKRYKEVWRAYKADKDLNALLNGIAAAGYATGPAYGKLLRAVASSPRVLEAVRLGRDIEIAV